MAALRTGANDRYWPRGAVAGRNGNVFPARVVIPVFASEIRSDSRIPASTSIAAKTLGRSITDTVTKRMQKGTILGF